MKLITLKSVLSESPRALSDNHTIANALEMMAELSISSIII